MDYNTWLTSEYFFLKFSCFRKQRAVEYLFNEVRRNKLTFGSTRAWLRESFGKHVPITADIPQSLSQFPRYYRGRYPHPRGITATVIPSTAVNTAVTTALPQSPSPCQSIIAWLLTTWALGLWICNDDDADDDVKPNHLGCQGRQDAVREWVAHPPQGPGPGSFPRISSDRSKCVVILAHFGTPWGWKKPAHVPCAHLQCRYNVYFINDALKVVCNISGAKWIFSIGSGTCPHVFSSIYSCRQTKVGVHMLKQTFTHFRYLSPLLPGASTPYKRWSKCTMEKVGGKRFCRNLGGEVH